MTRRFKKLYLDPRSQERTTCLPSISSSNVDQNLDLKDPNAMYQGLSTGDGEIRLLQIEPAENCETHIIARLFNAPLNNPSAYEAVSYRWEKMNAMHFIIVNGIKFPVMRNVLLLLSVFRRQAYPSSLTVWIDTVCINQTCIRDREVQVKLMGKIYSKASLVRMWIGPKDELAQQAFDLIRLCGPANEKSRELVAGIIVQNEAGTKALTEVLKRDYWSRMWMFQEIVLAKEAMVHCGDLQAPWSAFMWLDLISSKHIFWLRAQIEHPWIFEFRKALFRIAHFGISTAEARHVNNVIHPTRHLACQDPRDKLYALRGVCGDLASIVEVDYSAPVRDVFTLFAKKQILRDGNLSTLLTAGLWNSNNGVDINLPSWVPDIRGMSGVDIRYLAGHYTESFDACGSPSYAFGPENFFSHDGTSILKIYATLFNSIESHRLLLGISESDGARRELIKRFCLCNDEGRFSVSMLRQFFQGLIFGDKTTLLQHPHPERNILERARRLALGFYEDLCRLFGPDPDFTELLTLLECCTSPSEGYKSLQEEVRLCNSEQLHLYQMEYLMRAAETTDQQAAAMIITDDGRIGVGPRNVQQGDMVALARGSRVPFALRKHSSYYRLVGPVYVSGAMQGEGLRPRESTRAPDFQWIQLV